jgi:hypothetical protein
MKKEARKVLREAEVEEYKTHKLRQEYQLELQAKYEEDGNTSMATIIKRIRNAEITRRAWQKCAVARGKVYSGGLNNLEVPRDPAVTPKECQDWLYIEDPDLIETHLQSHLRTHFAQAEETDFRQSPLKEDTTFSADTPTADNILKGDTSQYDTARLRLSTAMLLQHMAMATDKEITTTLTDKHFDGKLKTWNERTTTSPSGVHLGHLKSYYAAHSLDPDTDEGKEITDMQEN